MPLDLETISGQVILVVKNAMAPLLERLAALDALKLGDVRDRVVALETKTSMPLPADPAVAELRERLLKLETLQSVEPEPDDVVSLSKRLDVLEVKASQQPVLTLPHEAGIDDLRERIKSLETRQEGPSPTEMGLVELRERLGRLEAKASDDSLLKDLGALRERVAVVEVKGGMPGPAGKDGKDGADGIGFDDLMVEHDGERGFTIKAARGERVKTIGTFTIPAMIYRGIFAEGKTYEPGDTVTWGGSMYHCQKSTVVKPDAAPPQGAQGKDFWTLVVKQGREGKAGRDGRDAAPLPVVGVR